MNLSKRGAELLSYIDSIMPENGHLEYDFRDEKQYEFAKMLLAEHYDQSRYPGMFNALEVQKKEQSENGFQSALEVTDSGFQNFFGISGLALDSSTNNIASNGLGTTVNGYSSMSLMLFIKDNLSGNIISSGTNNDLAGTLLPVKTPPNSGSTNQNVTSYLQYSATTNAGVPVNGIVSQSAYNTVADPAITAPITTTTGTKWVPGAINIGLGRPWTQQGGTSQFDYAWNEPTQNNPVGKIPFVGSVTFSQNIKPLAPNTNFLLQIYVANQSSGGTVTLQSTNLTDVYNSFSIDASNPKKLNWNLPPGASTTDPGNPITFQNITWPSDMTAIFHCSILVTMADGTFGSAVVESSTTPDNDPLDGTLQIEPIAFIWHCLSAGSLVTMADGSSKEIEKIVAGERVQTDLDGTIAEVNWTNKGRHADGEVLQIITENKHEIVSTLGHVFMSENGPSSAADLKVGQKLKTVDGDQRIIKITAHTDWDGVFCNLSTSTVEQTNKGNMGTFLANGFLVGDVNAQTAQRKRNKKDISWVKSKVPAEFHKDVESFFEDNK